MARPIISIENLGKAYRLGQKEEKYPTFRDAMIGAATAPFRRFQQLSGAGSEEEMFWALKDISFDVNRGEVVGIIGRNGAGKSTLLKILSRITEPTTGRAVLRGRVASLLEVGTGFHPELSGRENIYLNGSILGMKKSEIDLRFAEIVDFAEVEQFLDTPVKRYSSGMYVRLAFAVAAHLEPEVLIVDEVLAVGDAQFQKKCLGKMRDVAEGGGRTVLFVSHNMSAVRKLCTRGLFLKEGSVHTIDNAMSTIDSYLSDAEEESQSSEVVFERDSRCEFQIKRVSVVNSVGEVVPKIHSGETFGILTCTHAMSYQDQCELVLSITDSKGDLVTTLDTCLTGHYHKLPPGDTIWTCRVSDFYLSEGKYFISISAKNRFQDCDVRDNCLSFIVEGMHFELSARNRGRVMGSTMPPRRWSVAPESTKIN